jgi:glutathione S-transferase
MIKLYGPARSRTFRCLWTLEELGLPYQHISLDLHKGEHKNSEFLKLNPVGRVPVLVDGSVTLFESSAICCYLAEKQPLKNLIPKPGSVEHAYFFQWLSFVTTELEQGLWTMGKHTFALPEEKRLPQMKEIGAWEFSGLANVLEKAVRGKNFLVGDMFSVADIFAAHTLIWAKGFGVPVSGALDQYLQNLQQRSAFQNAFRLREKESAPLVV